MEGVVVVNEYNKSRTSTQTEPGPHAYIFGSVNFWKWSSK